jgi:heme A synthase
MLQRLAAAVVAVLLIIEGVIGVAAVVDSEPHRIVVDTDVATDDLFALLYLLKLNTSQFQLEVCI